MTAYFSDYPKIDYNGRYVKDITIRLDFLTRIKNNVSLFQFENLVDGERLEDIASKFYGDPELFWIVMYINDIVDPYYDWLLTEQRLHEYIVNKYGANNVNAVHHYETTDHHDLGAGVWCSSDEPFSTQVSNYTHEKNKNESKRKIKILKNRYVQQVLTEYRKELRNREDTV